MDDACYARLGEMPPTSPVVVSVPHAGRVYPPALLAAARVPPNVLVALEDRLIDRVALAAQGHETLFVQHLARAWIDLNRAEHERDPLVDEGVDAANAPSPSSKLRSGLGLVPRRIGGAGDLWRRRFTGAEIERRIANDHRPYHLKLAEALAAARARFGVAVLLDLHSMPSLGAGRARIVLSDRFGKSAGSRFVARVESELAALGERPALNAPYAGAHILERHGRPRLGVHAIQLEIDRTLYLDASGEAAGAGFARTVMLVRGVLTALADEASGPVALAAE